MPAPRPLREPHREIRFTRSRQATHFGLVGVAFVSVSAALGLLAWPAFVPQEIPLVASPWFALPPLLAGAAFFYGAAYLARHAFLLFSPVGIEIFPLFFPAKHFRLLMWAEVEDMAVDPVGKMLTVSLVGGDKVFVTLAPLGRLQRVLLARTVSGILEKREGEEITPP